MSRAALFTIGYEGRTLDDLVSTLVRAGVERVIDVRALPLSRRRGFSKTPLREGLSRRGVDYVHVRAAGNPFRELRDDPERCLALYEKHLDEHPEILEELKQAMGAVPCALLCLEADATRCHRTIVAKRLTRGRRTATRL